MIRDTSLAAYRDGQSSGEIPAARRRVYNALQSLDSGEGLTAMELFTRMQAAGVRNTVASNIRARLLELRHDGSVWERGKRRCSVTGRSVIVWTVNNPVE